jgi:hypothetical protein
MLLGGGHASSCHCAQEGSLQDKHPGCM